MEGLEKYLYKKVKITTKKGNVFICIVSDYFEPAVNQDGVESIGFDIPGDPRAYELSKSDISEIEIIA